MGKYPIRFLCEHRKTVVESGYIETKNAGTAHKQAHMLAGKKMKVETYNHPVSYEFLRKNKLYEIIPKRKMKKVV